MKKERKEQIDKAIANTLKGQFKSAEEAVKDQKVLDFLSEIETVVEEKLPGHSREDALTWVLDNYLNEREHDETNIQLYKESTDELIRVNIPYRLYNISGFTIDEYNIAPEDEAVFDSMSEEEWEEYDGGWEI